MGLNLTDEFTDLLRRRSVGAVHVAGQSDDHGLDIMGLNQFLKSGGHLLWTAVFYKR